MDLLRRTTIAIIAVLLTNIAIFAGESSASSYGLLKGRVLDTERNLPPGGIYPVQWIYWIKLIYLQSNTMLNEKYNPQSKG